VTKSITLVALVCLLFAGAAATSILTRDSVPVAGIGGMSAVVAKSPVSNREAKGDRLVVNRIVAAVDQPPQTESITQPLREAFAYAPADAEMPKPEMPKLMAPAAVAEVVAPRPKPAPVALKPEVQKAYALLSDGQIAGIKDRLKLSSDQEYYWPAVETALRAVAKKLHTTHQATNAKPGSMQIDPDSDEVQQLKSAAMPLLWQLRDDQKDEVRKLARLIGLDKVASAI
jgi:hypothetical protein